MYKRQDDFLLLLFQFGFDKSLVGNNHILEFLVDLNNLEFLSLIHILNEMEYLLWIYAWFYLAWGLNYSQKDFYGRTNIPYTCLLYTSRCV